LAPPRLKSKHRLFLYLGIVLYGLAYGVLYYKYVPRVLGFQLVLIPLVVVTVIVTVNSIRNGTLLVVFLIPVGSSLPYFYGLSGFNPLVFIFYGFVLGLLLHKTVHVERLGARRNPLFVPVVGASAVLIVSAVVTFWRYANFFPLNGGAVYDLAVNVLNVSAGEAMRRVLLDVLNWLGGFIWFVAVVSVARVKRIVWWAVSLLAVSSLLSFLFGLYQSVRNVGLGNQDWFIQSGRINALFTDPNALGVFLSLSLPVFAGVVLARRRLGKILFAVPILVGIFLIPDSGSRVGMLGLAVAFLVFVFLLLKMGLRARRENPGLWRSVIRHSGAAVLLLGLIAAFVLVNRESNLHYRVSENIKSLKVLFNPKAREIILHGRHLTWPSAIHMIREYPVSGIGLGAFTCELPNFYRKYDITPIMSSNYYREYPGPDIRVDSAGNYYLQVASEMGFVGLFFFGWIFFGVLKRIVKDYFRKGPIGEESFLGLGLSASVLAMFVIFGLGAHTLHFEILLAFWLCVGLLFAVSPAARREFGISPASGREGGESGESSGLESELRPATENLGRISPLCLVGLGLAVIIFGSFLTWDSFGRLSLRERTERFHLNQEFGFYQRETMDGRAFRWTGWVAGMTVKANKPVVVVPVLAAHPDIGEVPVEVKVFLTDNLFRSRTLLDEFELRGHGWRERRYDFGGRIGAEGIMFFEVSRTWRPEDVLGSSDPRDLGIAVGVLRFEGEVRESQRGELVYQFELSEGEGEMGGRPPHIREWQGEFSCGEGDYLIRLRAKGQAAGGEWPLAGVRIDGRLRGEDWVASEEWDDYYVRVGLQEGPHRVGVEFQNEAYVAQTREYRKLFVESLEIIALSDRREGY